MNDEFPYMPLFARDVLAELADLDATERGVLLSLMLAAWVEGGRLAHDLRRLALRGGIDPQQLQKLWPAIERHFEVGKDWITHPRVTAGLAHAREQKEARRRGAAATNAQRYAQRHAERPDSDTLSERSVGRTAGRSRVAISDPSPALDPDPAGGSGGAPGEIQKKSEPLADDDRARLEDLIAQHGQNKIAKTCDVDWSTVGKAAAGKRLSLDTIARLQKVLRPTAMEAGAA